MKGSRIGSNPCLWSPTDLYVEGKLVPVRRAAYLLVAKKMSKRDVALKILRQDKLHRLGLIRVFLNEASFLAKLPHPNIPTLIELCRTREGQPCIVMELLSTRTLQKEIDELHAVKNPWLEGGNEIRSDDEGVQRAIRSIATLCGCVEFAHQQGVLHRDIKPSNIAFQSRNSIYLGRLGGWRNRGNRVLIRTRGAQHLQRCKRKKRLRKNTTSTTRRPGLLVLLHQKFYWVKPQRLQAMSLAWVSLCTRSWLASILFRILTHFNQIILFCKNKFSGPRELNPSIPKPLEAIWPKSHRAKP